MKEKLKVNLSKKTRYVLTYALRFESLEFSQAKKGLKAQETTSKWYGKMWQKVEMSLINQVNWKLQKYYKSWSSWIRFCLVNNVLFVAYLYEDLQQMLLNAIACLTRLHFNLFQSFRLYWVTKKLNCWNIFDRILLIEG